MPKAMIDESSAAVMTADAISTNGVFPIHDWNGLLMWAFAADHYLSGYGQTAAGLKNHNLAVRSNRLAGKLCYAFGQNLLRVCGAPPAAFVSF